MNKRSLPCFEGETAKHHSLSGLIFLSTVLKVMSASFLGRRISSAPLAIEDDMARYQVERPIHLQAFSRIRVRDSQQSALRRV